MFQSFDNPSEPQFGKDRVFALRARLVDLGVNGFLVPRADAYQGEYVPPAFERLSWLTGFTGSAGMALVTADEAIVFVDGRYTTQLAQQVDPGVFSGGDLVGAPAHVWIERHAFNGFRLGIDPWLHTGAEVKRLQKALAKVDGELVILDSNPLDEIWTDRPDEPLGLVSVQAENVSGYSAHEKILDIATGLKTGGLAAVLITDPSSVAWIFNIRGNDVPHTPHPLSRAVIKADGSAALFLDKRKTGIEQEAYLAQMATQMAPEDLPGYLADLSAGQAKILIDPDVSSFALTEIVRKAGGLVVEGSDPAKLPRACKNTVEINGSAAAHIQDGAAMVEFLCWLDAQPLGSVTEIQAVKALESARRRVGEAMQNPLKDISFDTISGAGSNAAIIHYRVTEETDRLLEAGEMFLVDSGGQYVNGTTDITRTVAIGDVPAVQRRFFTLVLKGMIAISTARFPQKTRGVDLDPLARIALWKAGVDYGHGTGHGVGSYLSVHEGPQRISRAAMQELLPGMILSNEPGYYRPGAFGIRIENLLYVREPEEIDDGDAAMMGFETLTFCPIDTRLILTSLLSAEELIWLNDYHVRTREMLMPLIRSEETRTWLQRATEPLGRVNLG